MLEEFLHPSVMSLEQVIMLFCEPEKDDYVPKATAAIRKNEMICTPQPSDYEQEKFKTLSKLNEFLTCLLTVKEENQINSRSARHSLSRYSYIVNNGRMKTPKSLLLPGVIKTLANKGAYVKYVGGRAGEFYKFFKNIL